MLFAEDTIIHIVDKTIKAMVEILIMTYSNIFAKLLLLIILKNRNL